MKKLLSSLAIVVLFASAATTAHALSYTGTKYGSYIYTSGTLVSLKDNKDDGQFPSVNYKYDGGTKQAGFSNKSGYNTVVVKTAPSAVTGIQPCVSRTLLPASCGGWIY